MTLYDGHYLYYISLYPRLYDFATPLTLMTTYPSRDVTLSGRISKRGFRQQSEVENR
jgi:hypothetical protein